MKSIKEIKESGKVWNIENFGVMACGLIKLPD